MGCWWGWFAVNFLKNFSSFCRDVSIRLLRADDRITLMSLKNVHIFD